MPKIVKKNSNNLPYYVIKCGDRLVRFYDGRVVKFYSRDGALNAFNQFAGTVYYSGSDCTLSPLFSSSYILNRGY